MNRTPALRKHSRGALLVLAFACLAVLEGCGHAQVKEDWEHKASMPPLPAVYLVVARSELEGVCGAHPGMYLHGCAKRDYVARVCTIVTGPQPQAWLLDHERKHCAGWDHGAPRTVSG